MTKWRNEAGEELTVPVHQLLDCTTMQDERRQWCIGGFAWIPCNERMPPTEGPGFDPIVYVWAWCADYGEANEGSWDGVEWFFPNGRLSTRVTHWMPLPPGPEYEP